ncbi:MAG: iron-containing alcohol dehydrogenase [Verrucomicrobiota bacterium]|jgi:alcohol dehydrogenase class IV
MRFEFATASRIIFGAGAIRQAGPLAGEFGRRALVTTGRDATRAKRLLEALREVEVGAVSFAIEGEPDLEMIRRGVALARQERCDLVIGFGGGSALDAGKAIAAMLTNDGDVLDYLEVIGGGKALARSPAPMLAIPTTAGTGAEVTRNSVLTSPGHRLKVSLRSPLMLPKVALVDPELTWDLPPALTASTGLDALTQLIEPYVSGRANPMTDGLCVEGIRRAARSLRIVLDHSHNADAREAMALASLFGGLALANAGLGAVHGLAGVIGGMFGAPHGAICAALLPRVMSVNLAALRSRDPASPALPRYQEVAGLLTGRNNARADDGVDWVAQLVSDLQIPRLGAYGLTARHTADLVEKSKNASSMKANPIVLTREELSAVVEEAL